MPGDEGLARLLIGLHLEGWILVGELGEGQAHLLLIGLGLRLHGHLDHRIREGHGLEGDRVLLVTQRVTGGNVLEAHEGVDVAGLGCVYRVLLVSVHLEDLADAFLLALRGIEHVVARLDGAGIDAHEHELAIERVRRDLEHKGRERVVHGGLAVDLDGFIGRIEADDGRNVLRARQIVNNGIEHRLHALVLEGGTAEHRISLAGDGELTDGATNLLLREVAVLEILLEQLLIGLRNLIEQFGTVLLSAFLEIVRNLHGVIVGTLVVLDVVPNVCLHTDEVDDAREIVLSTDRQLDDERSRTKLLLDGAHRVVEVGTELVHLVDEADARNAVLVGLTPHGLRLGLHTLLAVEHCDGAVEHAKRTLHLGGEVHVARGVNDVDLELLVRIMSLAVPEAGGRSGLDGDAAFLLLSHEVHRRSTLVGFADLVVLTGVEQNTLGSGGLAGIDVCHVCRCYEPG